MSGSRMRMGQAMTAGRGGWRPQWRHEDFDEASSTAGSGDGGSDAAAVRRPSSSHGILRTISTLAQRSVHPRAGARLHFDTQPCGTDTRICWTCYHGRGNDADML